MVEQQRDLALGARQLRHRKVGLAQRRPRHRERVDGVALAKRPRRLPGAGHQLRRHPTDPLPRPQQRRLEVTREVRRILDRPLALDIQTIGERQQLTTPVLVGRHRPLGQLSPRPGVDGHRGVRQRMCASIPITITSRFSLARPQPIRTAGGQHIVKATKRRPGSSQSHQRSSDAASATD